MKQSKLQNGLSAEISFNVPEEQFSRKELWFAMNYRDAEPDEAVRAISEKMILRLVPKATVRYMFRIVPACKTSPSSIKLGGIEFTPGPIICSYLKGMSHACVFVGTAGVEFDEERRKICGEGDIVNDFIADSIGSVLAESSVARLESDFANHCPDFEHSVLSMPYSPGYCGWDVREQHKLFSLFPPGPCGITLTGSSLMIPEKSVSGFFALGEELVKQPYHCQICRNSNCYKRRNA